jgi:hypothetical protein
LTLLRASSWSGGASPPWSPLMDSPSRRFDMRPPSLDSVIDRGERSSSSSSSPAPLPSSFSAFSGRLPIAGGGAPRPARSRRRGGGGGRDGAAPSASLSDEASSDDDMCVA